MLDALILSDLHLGSDNCQARLVCDLLERIHSEDVKTSRLILNGDVFNSIDFRRLKKSHWKVLSLLRKLSDKIDITWLCGNHDGTAEIVSPLLGVSVEDEYVLQSGDRKILILHGHIFDEFIDAHPILTFVADCFYSMLQRVDRTHYFAKLAKKGSKTFLRCAQVIQQKAIDHARKKHCQAVCCGHTHVAVAHQEGDVHYFNSGCWTELPCHYLTVSGGMVSVQAFQSEEQAAAQPMMPVPIA